MFKQFTNKLSLRLKKTLPGEKAHMLMGSDLRIKEFKFMPVNENTKSSGVLILLYPYKKQLFSTLILRTKDKSVHSGQVALPGGKSEKYDSNIVDTALREASEEIGINKSKVTILGKLTKIYIPPSNFIIYPVVGYINNKPVFTPDSNEVQQIIEYDVCKLLNKNNIKTKVFEINRNINFSAPYFDVNGHVVWGATAMVLSEFAEILKEPEFSELFR